MILWVGVGGGRGIKSTPGISEDGHQRKELETNPRIFLEKHGPRPILGEGWLMSRCVRWIGGDEGKRRGDGCMNE